ncbi:MAG: hypothetical protein ABF665_06325 [Gluconacetobacter sp.]
MTSGVDPNAVASAGKLVASDDGVNWAVIDRHAGQYFAWKRQAGLFLIGDPCRHGPYCWQPQERNRR